MRHPAAPRDDSWFAAVRHGGGGEESSETETEPWDAQQPYLKEGFFQAGQNILNRPLEYFPGKTWIPYSPESRMAMGAQASRARSGSPLLRGAQGYTGDVMGGSYLDSRPGGYLGGSGAEGGDASKIYDSILSQVEPAVASRWASAGRMGGSPSSQEAFGRGVTRSIAPYEFGAAESAAERQSREFMNEMGLEYGRHGMERGFMEDAARRSPGLAREDYFDIGKLAEVGRMREAKKGEKLADRMARWEFAQNEPGNRIERFMRQIQGNYGGTSTAQQTGGGTNPLLLGTGAALSLAGLPIAGGGSLGGGVLSDATIICTEAHRQGFFDDELMAGDKAFADRLARNDPEAMAGYHILASPIVEAMRASRTTCGIVAFLARPVANQMAAEAGHRLFGNLIGKAVLAVGIPLCRAIGSKRLVEA